MTILLPENGLSPLGPGFLSTVFLSVLALVAITTPLMLYASESGIEFYTSPPSGMESFEPLIAKWWNWRISQPYAIATNWPECLKSSVVIGNQSVVFLGDPASAVERNVNARNQTCELSSQDNLYLTVYAGECSTGAKPHEGEFPDMKSPDDLLLCAQDANRVIKLMQVKVDGVDVSPNIIRQTTSEPFSLLVPEDNPFEWGEPIVGGNNTAMAENYFLLFKSLPIGVHEITVEVIRQPIQANQPVEHDVAKWNIEVVS